MVAMGIDIRNAVLLMNEPDIREIIADIERDGSIVTGVAEKYKPLITRLESKLAEKDEQYSKISETKLKEIRNSLRARNPEMSKKDLDAELTRQVKLHKHYNPVRQLLVYAKLLKNFKT